MDRKAGQYMKFWKKIFLASIGLFLCLYFAAGFLLIERIHGEKLQLCIRTGLNKFTEIENSLYLNTDYIIYEDYQDESALVHWLEIIINGYNMNSDLANFGVEIFNMDNQRLMTNASFGVLHDRKELEQASYERSFLIRRIDGKHYLFVSGVINLNNKELKLIVSNQIESLEENKKQDYRFFVLIGLGMTCIMAVCLYVITKKLTDPIETLSAVSQDIRSGDYSKRVPENGTSKEVVILQKNFNQMIDDMQIQMEELQEMNESKQSFIDSLSHEIKTPITSILGYSDLLMKGKLTRETEVKALSFINQEAKRLELINSTLLKLIVVKQMEEAVESVSITECFRSAESALRYKLEQRQIELQAEVADCWICGNRSQFQILLINLMDNAVKASSQGGQIEVNGTETDRGYELRIRDFGIGIPKEDLNKIFEPFYVVDKARTRKENGLGLGLAICEQICKRYQITFSIESEVQKGSEVTLIFQIVKKQQAGNVDNE